MRSALAGLGVCVRGPMGWLVLAIGVVLSGCASMTAETQQRQVASMLGFLYPGRTEVAAPPDRVAELRVPFRVGVAFVPDQASPTFRLAETDRLRLAGVVRDAFANYPFVSQIEAVPSLYLEPGGGFENLERIAALLRLDVVALISCDQVQFASASPWSLLYWTGIGAYVVSGDQYDVLTVVETAVFDVPSRQLLMRASGSSTVKGEATWIGFEARSREARTTSFDEALAKMVQRLHGEVAAFRARAPKDPRIRLVLPPGYDPRAGAAR